MAAALAGLLERRAGPDPGLPRLDAFMGRPGDQLAVLRCGRFLDAWLEAGQFGEGLDAFELNAQPVGLSRADLDVLCGEDELLERDLAGRGGGRLEFGDALTDFLAFPQFGAVAPMAPVPGQLIRVFPGAPLGDRPGEGFPFHILERSHKRAPLRQHQSIVDLSSRALKVSDAPFGSAGRRSTAST
jgi:hypothetical protein